MNMRAFTHQRVIVYARTHPYTHTGGAGPCHTYVNTSANARTHERPHAHAHKGESVGVSSIPERVQVHSQGSRSDHHTSCSNTTLIKRERLVKRDQLGWKRVQLAPPPLPVPTNLLLGQSMGHPARWAPAFVLLTCAPPPGSSHPVALQVCVVHCSLLGIWAHGVIPGVLEDPGRPRRTFSRDNCNLLCLGILLLLSTSLGLAASHCTVTVATVTVPPPVSEPL